jgi:hypothetical protein
MATYDRGDRVRLTGTFRYGPLVTDAPVNPDAVSLLIRLPDGTLQTETWPGGNVVQDSTGVFYFDFDCQITGRHSYKWAATGEAIAAEQSSFFVNDDITPPGP